MEWNKVQFHREYSNNFHGKLWEYSRWNHSFKGMMNEWMHGESGERH